MGTGQMGAGQMISAWHGLLLGLALFFLFGLRSVWSEESETCDGTVVRNFWGWPTCVESGIEHNG